MLGDAISLGVTHAALNVDLTQLIDPKGLESSIPWEFEGKTYHFLPEAVAGVDVRVKRLSDQGMLIYLILLPYHSGDAERNRIMLHPAYAAGDKTAGPIGMFNITSDEGIGWLNATSEFLADRYSSDRGHGRVWGYIVGNEVNSHWHWANMGRTSIDEVVKAYEQSTRIVHNAVRKASDNARIYLSLDHCWGQAVGFGDETQETPGKDFLDKFAALAQKNGDFDWHIAYHPYPEPLTDPRFWLDHQHSTRDEAAKVITFRNLDLLTDYLQRPELLWNGEPRRVILSEQGFHCMDQPDGEQIQAAAYALAYEVVDRLSGIDAFILHRHVDHAHEGGLKLGLWTNKEGSVATPDRKRPMYHAFEAAGTPAQAEAFQFALPILGAESWDQAIEQLKQYPKD